MKKLKDMLHATMHLYKGKEGTCIIKEEPMFLIKATISHREKRHSFVKFHESLYLGNNQYKDGDERLCTVEEFIRILRDEYQYLIGNVTDSGNI